LISFAATLTADADALTGLATRGLGLGIALVLVQCAFAVRFALNIFAYQRGVWSHEWYWGLRRWQIAPRQLATRCAYLCSHVASHAPTWELAVWLRQFLLLGVGIALNESMDAVHSVTASTASTVAAERAAVRYGWASAALLVVLATGCAQEHVRPYALDVQNRLLARWLIASNAMLVLLGMVFTAIAQYDTTPGATVVEVRATPARVRSASCSVLPRRPASVQPPPRARHGSKASSLHSSCSTSSSASLQQPSCSHAS
jgi:hypothetical protein